MISEAKVVILPQRHRGHRGDGFFPGRETTASFTQEGQYVLKLSVYDGADTTEDTVTVHVGPPINDYSCSMKITIDHTKVDASSYLYDFPVLISLTDTSLKLTTDTPCGYVTSSLGYDIMFTNGDKTLQLDHEIEKFTSSTGELLAWVEVPELKHDDYTVIYMYYGNSGAGDQQTGDQQNPDGLWDPSVYEAVYHLQDNSLVDSTSNNHDSTADDTAPIDGRILGGQDFVPQDEIAIGNWSVSGQELTLQAWANFHNFTQDDPRVIVKANGTSAVNHVFMLGLGGTGEQHLRMRVKTGTSDGSGTTTIADSDNAPTYPLSANTWYLIAGTYDGTDMKLYRNGVEAESTGKTGNLRVNTWNIALGNHPGNITSGYTTMDGWLDEVRILKK
jgi:hypothetical protein